MESKNRKRTGRIAVLVVVALLVVVFVAGAVFAATPGALNDFQTDRLADAKANLDARVADGTLDQATADEWYARMQTRIATCTAALDGTGNPDGGAYRGGRGRMGDGAGTGRANGAGMGYRGGNGGVCVATVTPAA